MAYNGAFGNYSPYFNSQQGDSNERSQFSYQNTPGSNGGYQRQTYATPTPNASISNQQQPQSSQNAYGTTARYTNLEGQTHPGYQNQRNEYGYASGARTAGDTSALGNLAYASTLRSSGDNVQRVGDYNRQASAGGYDQAQGQIDGQNIQRTDSRGSRPTSGINSPSTTAQSYSAYPATASQQNLGQQSQQNQQYTAYTGNYGGYQSSAYPHSQPMRHEVSDTRRASYQATAPPSRPASGQSTHASHVRSSQANHSPRVNAYTPAQPPSGPAPSQAQVPTTQSYKPSAPSVPAPISRPKSTQTARPEVSSTSSNPGNPNPSNSDHPANSHSLSQSSNSKKLATPHRNKPQPTQLPPVKNLTPVQNTEPQTTVVQQQHPTTVDPNQVFNHYEYEKRQAEAEAAKRKAAADVEQAKKKAEAIQQAQLTAQKNLINGALINGEDDEARKKEQMEAEMKLMLEKMREYKSKDPALFSQIWETVKKAQPPTSSKDSIQAPAAELPASREVALPSPQVPIVQSPSTTPVISAATENPIENGELDRGKFPAARRGRPGKKSKGGRSSLSAIKHSDVHDTLNMDGEARASNNIAQGFDPPAVTPQTPTTNVPPSEQSEPSVQKVWVSGKKPLKSAMKPASRKITLTPSTPIQPPGTTSSTVDFGPSNSAPRASGQTLWPEADKWNLASAARDTLLSNPKNVGKLISSTEIHNILNQGPSYDELCEILEAKGFVVDRTPFAQQLLAAVPKLKQDPQGSTSAPKPQSSTTWQATDTSASNNVAPTAPMFANLPPGQDWQTHTNEHPAIKKDKIVRRKKTKPDDRPSEVFSTSHQTRNGSIEAATQQPAEPLPLSKQEQARKRSFGEIVDLTAEMSSDEELKRQRARELKKIEQLNHMQQVKATMEAAMASKAIAETSAPPQDRNDLLWKSKGIRPSPGAGAGPSSSAAASDDDAVPGLSRFKSHSTPIGERLRKARDVIKPINGRADALRRSTYSSNTIARDILVAAGKHPTMSALNYHLDPLRSAFRHVDYGSDLGTFNWELIDPGGPPVKPRIVEEEQLPPQDDVNDADDEEIEEADESITQGLQSNQARRSRLAVTNVDSGAEDVVMLDAAPSGPIKGFFPAGPSSGGGRGRGQGRGRGRGPRPSRGGLPRASSRDAAARSSGQPQISQVQIPRNSDVSMLGAGISAPISASNQPSTPSAKPVNRTEAQASFNPPDPGKRRRGRPPKNRTSTTPLNTDDSSSPLSVPSQPLLTDHTASAAAPSPAAAPPPSNENPSSNLAESSTMPESRVAGTPNFSRISTTPARPSGLRNQIITSPFAVVIPRSPNTNESASRQAKTKQVKSSPAPLPKYQVYRCRWKNCEGKLHNLETLRKHVRNHLSEFDDDLKCLWQDCGTTNVGSLTGERQPLTFKSETAWERHMNGRHLEQYAWELGDGPSPHPSG